MMLRRRMPSAATSSTYCPLVVRTAMADRVAHLRQQPGPAAQRGEGSRLSTNPAIPHIATYSVFTPCWYVEIALAARTRAAAGACPVGGPATRTSRPPSRRTDRPPVAGQAEAEQPRVRFNCQPPRPVRRGAEDDDVGEMTGFDPERDGRIRAQREAAGSITGASEGLPKANSVTMLKGRTASAVRRTVVDGLTRPYNGEYQPTPSSSPVNSSTCPPTEATHPRAPLSWRSMTRACSSPSTRHPGSRCQWTSAA